MALPAGVCRGEGRWEMTAGSKQASALGLQWLARNQGEEGNWGSRDLGLVSVGALAFLSAGHTTEAGQYRQNIRRALDYVLAHAKPSGLLNIAGKQRDMYNHGLSTFVLTQVYGMTNDRRVGKVLVKALKLISDTQCLDGGWSYEAKRQSRGHDLSLAVMQAKALRGATDVGIHIPRGTIAMAIKSVQGYYRSPVKRPDGKGTKYGPHPLARYPGRFTYNGGKSTTAMAAAGAVCLQEYGKYEDFRIYRSIDGVLEDIRKLKATGKGAGRVPFDAYTLYYVAQALYQVGEPRWRQGYPKIRDALVAAQVRAKIAAGARSTSDRHGSWESGHWVSGTGGRLFGTAVAVFTLNIPNRFLPILQKGQREGRSSPPAAPRASAPAGGQPRVAAPAGPRGEDLTSTERR